MVLLATAVVVLDDVRVPGVKRAVVRLVEKDLVKLFNLPDCQIATRAVVERTAAVLVLDRGPSRHRGDVDRLLRSLGLDGRLAGINDGG